MTLILKHSNVHLITLHTQSRVIKIRKLNIDTVSFSNPKSIGKLILHFKKFQCITLELDTDQEETQI